MNFYIKWFIITLIAVLSFNYAYAVDVDADGEKAFYFGFKRSVGGQLPSIKEEKPDIIKRMVDEGHIIGDH